MNRFRQEMDIYRDDELDDEYPETVVDANDARRVKLAKRATNRKRLQLRYSAAAKLEFGTPDRTKSNLLCVRDYIIRTMRADHVRNCDIIAVIDETVAMVFVPTEDEIKWKQFIYSEAVDVCHAELNSKQC